MQKLGTLYVVATPIGNLQDITLRAIDILKQVDLIAAEDTRHAKSLLKHYSVDKPTISMHNFNETERVKGLLEKLQKGKDIALISDAGTPLISDPGYVLVKAAREHHIPVVPIPGACAAIASLCVSGLPTNAFIFLGFLSAKKGERVHQLTDLKYEQKTMIFYEAPHRLLETLQAMNEIFGSSRKVVITRELTKIHESIYSGSFEEMTQHFIVDSASLRGEMVMIVSGNNEINSERKEINTEQVLDVLCAELPIKQAASLVSKITGVRKNILYQKVLQKKKI